MPHGIRHTYGMLAEKTKLPVMVGVVCRYHSAVAGCNKLPGMKRKTGDVAVRLAKFFPRACDIYFTPYCTCRVFNHGKAKLSGKRKYGFYVAGHSHLMDRHDCGYSSDWKSC